MFPILTQHPQYQNAINTFWYLHLQGHHQAPVLVPSKLMCM